MFLDELVQKITVKANTKAYDVVDKKQKTLISNNSMLASSFSKAFALLGGAFAFGSITRVADEWTNIASSLSLVTKNEEERLRVEKELFAISQKTRQSMTSSVELYRRISISAKSMNLSEKERLQATENINKAVIIGGGTSASQQAALFQLSQGLASGQLRGQELNSVLEQTPRLAQLIAEGMGLEVGDLRKTAEAGKITASEVMRAVLSQTKTLNKEYANIKPTISSSMMVLRNSFGLFVNEINKAGGVTEILASGIRRVAKVIESPSFINSFKALGYALAFVFENMIPLTSSLLLGKLVLLGKASWAVLAPWLLLSAKIALIVTGLLAIVDLVDTLRGKETFTKKFLDWTDSSVGKGLDWVGSKTGMWSPKGYLGENPTNLEISTSGGGASVNQTINITSNAEVSPEKIQTVIKQENEQLMTRINMQHGFTPIR